MSLADFDRVISKFVRGIEALAKEAAARAVREALAKQKKNKSSGSPAGSRRVAPTKKAPGAAKRGSKANLKKADLKKTAKRGRPTAVSRTSAVAPSRPVRSPKLPPRRATKPSEADIDLAAGRIVAYLTTHPRVSSARLRLTLSLSREEWSRASEKLLASERITARGEGASTTYHLPGTDSKGGASDDHTASASDAAPRSRRAPAVTAPSAVLPIKRVRPQD